MHYRSKTLLIAALAAIALVAAGEAFAKTLSAQDFVTKASMSDKFEIESGKLALDRSQSRGVKDFAQRLIDDHTQSAEKLQSALPGAGANLHAAQTLDAKHRKLMEKLRSAPAKSFDREYIDMQVKAHKKAVALFSGYASDGTDKTLRNFAALTLPTLKEHLTLAEQLQSKQ